MAAWVLDKHSNKSTKLTDEYKLGKVLGKGAFGTVYLAEDGVKQAFACKSISKAKLITEEDVKDVRREVEVLNLVSDHANVAALQATYEDTQHVHMVLELCRGGELFDRIISKGTFTEKTAAEYFRTMVEVVHHLHQLGVMHRDIKPENFLLTTPGDDAVLKLCDFGLSAYWRPGQKLSSVVGSSYYVSPEVLRRAYSVEADIWSLGVMLYILLSGLPPFWGDTEEDIFRMVLKGNIDFKSAPWPSISEAAKDCVRKLLTMDPAQRPTAQQILEHPWLLQQGAAPDRPLDNIVLTRMKKFAAMNKLKKAALLVIAKSLNPDEITGLQQLFRSIDVDNSGTITVDELRTAMRSLDAKLNTSAWNDAVLKGTQETELIEAMHAADLDGDGTINYEEFIVATVNLAKLEKEKNFAAAFAHFDRDGSGSLTTDEIRAALATLGVTDEEVHQMIETFDTNKDGEIDYPEFLAMMRANNKGLQDASTYFRSRPTSGVATAVAAGPA